ncbi:hypothetical protein AMAG_10658 [Allomyces macrogynus ATCC 38327]|uniref:Major facilitator superfamily (MFS) profile domain-containing protein n=1 Tax=Allomyces macrogynus (strain ATCC 38327) TaxID=578462 RepID=A0A0L0SRL6_ALLM3|nr:hypothetical protein AMAG_10658 [Allomyces macrogynus ATCC 38327]|eukprot:KNE64989.1 hypothetical protein AMAG_10658 [Allomyces macrogynus ATCC 38327]
MFDFIAHHFADTKLRRTPEQEARSRYLIGSVPFQRWMLIPASMLAQMCAGSFYAWSVYNGPIAHMVEAESVQEIAETFYISVAFLGVASCIGGPFLERYGPTKIEIIGGTLFMLGQMISAVGCYLKLVPVLYVGFGVIGGTGIGLSYITPIAATAGITRPYNAGLPRKRGFASAGAVGSVLAAGSVIASFSQAALLSALGPIYTFIVLGCTYFVIQVIAGLHSHGHVPDPQAPHHDSEDTVHHNAHHDAHHDHHDATGLVASVSQAPSPVPAAKKMVDPHGSDPSAPGNPFFVDLVSRNFIMVCAIYFLAVIPGLVMVSRIANIAQTAFTGITASTATWVTGVNGLFNVIGRLLFGVLSDKINRMVLFMVSISLTIVSLVLLLISFHTGSFALFLPFMWCLTMCYGAPLGVVPSLIAEVVGPKNLGALYGIATTAWAMGGVIGGVGFTAVIQSQVASGVESSRIYDICIYAMLPLASLGIILTIIFYFLVRRDRQAVRGTVPHPTSNQRA